MAELPTEGVAVNDLSLVATITNEDIVYVVQSNTPKSAKVNQLSDSILGDISNSASITNPPIDSIVCIKDGVVSQLTPEILVAIYQPSVTTFTMDIDNLSLDCSTLDKGVVELNIEIDVINLPTVVSYGSIFNVQDSNLKKIYIKKIVSRTFNTPLYYLPKVGRNAKLPYIRISLGVASTTIDNKTTFAFYGFQEGSVLTTTNFISGDIQMPYDYCDYLEINNSKKVKRYYSIQGLVTTCNLWGTVAPLRRALPCASWLFLFGANEMSGNEGTRFIDSNNVSFKFTSANNTSQPDIPLLNFALKCSVWAENGYDASVLSNLITDSYTVSTKRTIQNVGQNALQYNVAESMHTLAPSILSGADSNGWFMNFNADMTFYNSDYITSGWTIKPIGFILANIVHFEVLQ